MELYCVAAYKATYEHRLIIGVPGEVLHVEDEAAAEWLLRDAPDCFHKTKSKEFERLAKEPMQNRMVKSAAMNDRMAGEPVGGPDRVSPVMHKGNTGAVKD